METTPKTICEAIIKVEKALEGLCIACGKDTPLGNEARTIQDSLHQRREALEAIQNQSLCKMK